MIVKQWLARVIGCIVLPPYDSAVCFYRVFNLYNCAWVWVRALGSHTPGVGSPHFRLSQAGHTVGVCCTRWDSGDRQRGRKRWPRVGRICQDSAKTHVCVADTWGLLSERTFQNSQIRPPRLWYSIYMHMNKLGPKITIFKLVEQVGGEV